MKSGVKDQITALFSGVLIAYAITCIVFIGYAILLTYTSVTESNIPLVVTITSIISVMVAGFDAARVSSNKGWLWGLIAGFVYGILLICIMIWVQKAVIIDSRTITLVILSLAGGGLGGVIGINFKK